MKWFRVVVWVAILSLMLPAPSLLADSPLKSSSYEVDESFIGGGGLISESSPNYMTNESIGDVGIGESSSTNFTSEGGYTTTSDPALTFIVTSGAINFGLISNTTTATATATFSVIDYTSYGYNVIVVGNPPSSGSRTLAGMTTAAASQQGVEQFGINLKANTSPISFGAEASGGYGVAAPNFNTANKYRYNSGDIIATSPRSSGQTNFTISYIVNASTTTGGGTYKGNEALICVGTY